ncbi:MAG: alpha/beta fold hydrolase [Gemmatimonadota bacterium]
MRRRPHLDERGPRAGGSPVRPIITIAFPLLALAWGGQGLLAQTTVNGTWRGDLATPAGALTLVLTIEGDGGTVGVPARYVAGIPITEVVLAGDGSLSFQVPADRAAFEGRLAAGDRIVGEWVQAGQRIPIEFERVEADDVPTSRPRRQTPEPPFPYHAEDVVLTAGETLACTMTLPADSSGSAPGAVLLTVAGANDRDQTHSGHKPFMVLADHLTRNGIAVLRCDDRGVGGSSGDLTGSTIDDLVADALVMVRYLSARDGVGPVGVIGNSEGSVVGSLAAARAPDEVAFAILLGGVGVQGADLIRERLVRQAIAAGRTADEAEAAMAPFDSLTRAVLTNGGVGAVELERRRPEAYDRLAEMARAAGTRDPFLPTDVTERTILFASPWYYDQLSLDGGMVLEHVPVPVLALTGSKDRVNLPDQNLPAIRAALERGGNTDAQVTEIPDLNHVFQTALTGGMAEYGTLEESFAPVALEIITKWILSRFQTEKE